MERRKIVLCFTFFAISVQLVYAIDKCTDPMDEDGICIYSENCPRITAILENRYRRRNDSIFVSDSFCGRTFVNNVSRLKVCCDATTVTTEPGCTVPSFPSNGEFKIKDSIPEPGSVVPHRSVLKYNCHENFRPDPQRSIYCQKHDEWSNRIVCVPKDEDLSNVNLKQNCQYPEKAIRTNRTKQIAWNKCVDLAETVFPCEKSPMGQRRIEKCEVLPESDFSEPKPIKPDEFPFIATLVFYNSSYFNSCTETIIKCTSSYKNCGGTLISDQWVLISAHCIYNRVLSKEVEYVKFSNDALDTKSAPKYTYKVVEVIKHPDYLGYKRYNDIALLKLEYPVTFSSKIRPACLHVGNEIDDSKLISIWWERDTNDTILYKESLTKYSYEECNTMYRPSRTTPDGIRNDTQICAGSGRKRNECPLNSGFPLLVYNENVFCTYTIVATGAFGKDCIYGFPDVYTKISPYISWIESIVWP